MKAEDYVHRIGRTGRAGRAGLAVTLAERRDVGMVRRIEHFTTQNIPHAVVPGLEPQRPAPDRFPPRPARPSYGQRPGFGGPRSGAPRYPQRDEQRGFDHRGEHRHPSDAGGPHGHADRARGPFGDPRGIAPRRDARSPQGGARDQQYRRPRG
jgi:superfamily II DNA/RNA helicase